MNTTPERPVVPSYRKYPRQYAPEECYPVDEPNGLNWYGFPIVLPEYYEGEHYAAKVPPSAGNPPVCSCGWTRWSTNGRDWFELADHLRDMSL